MDIRCLKLPGASLTKEEAAEVVGVCLVEAATISRMARVLFEAELAAERQAEEWGVAGFDKAAGLMDIHRRLERQLAPVRDLLPTDVRCLIWANDPALVRVCYYVWLKFFQREGDQLVYAAATLWGNWRGGALGLARRIGRNQEILILQNQHKGATMDRMKSQGLATPAVAGLRNAPENDHVAYQQLVRSVRGVARRRGLPMAADGQEDRGNAALALSQNLPPTLAGVLDSSTRHQVQAAGLDYFDMQRLGRAARDARTVEADDEALESLSDERARADEARTVSDDLIEAVEAHLSDRSRAVLAMMREGFREAEIARSLGLDKSTVHHHKKQIRKALVALGIDPLRGQKKK
jgi:hypothetical protein